MEQSLLKSLRNNNCVKTNILSKCIYLFSSLPRSDNFQKQLNQILSEFVWDGKPDKMKRTTICHDYLEGGLKMII